MGSKDLVIKAAVASPYKEQLFHVIANNIGLKYAFKASRYHVTLAYLKNVLEQDQNELLLYFEDGLKRIWLEYSKMNFNIAGAIIFYNKIALTPANPKIFKDINLVIWSLLDYYNSKYSKNYSFELNSANVNYTPHLTIGEGSKKCIAAIDSLIKQGYFAQLSSMGFSQIVAKYIP